jgi:hypothetical protein
MLRLGIPYGGVSLSLKYSKSALLAISETAYSRGKFKHDSATLRQIWTLCSLYKQEWLWLSALPF